MHYKALIQAEYILKMMHYLLRFTGNLRDVAVWTQRWTFQAIMNATFSVDSFFVLRYLINLLTLVLAIMKIIFWRPLSQFLIWNQHTKNFGREETTDGTTFGCIERVFLVHPMCNTTSELNILNIAITKSMKIIFWRPLSQFFIWNQHTKKVGREETTDGTTFGCIERVFLVHPMCNTTSDLNILNIAITKSMKIIFWRPLSQFFIWNQHTKKVGREETTDGTTFGCIERVFLVHPMCNTTSELNILNIAITKSMKIIFWRPLSQFFIWNQHTKKVGSEETTDGTTFGCIERVFLVHPMCNTTSELNILNIAITKSMKIIFWWPLSQFFIWNQHTKKVGREETTDGTTFGCIERVFLVHPMCNTTSDLNILNIAITKSMKIIFWRPLSQFFIWNQHTKKVGSEETTNGTTFGCIERVFLVHPMCNTTSELNILNIAITKSMTIIFWRPLSQFFIWNQHTKKVGSEETTDGTTFGCIERVFLVHPMCNTTSELNILNIAITKSMKIIFWWPLSQFFIWNQHTKKVGSEETTNGTTFGCIERVFLVHPMCNTTSDLNILNIAITKSMKIIFWRPLSQFFIWNQHTKKVGSEETTDGTTFGCIERVFLVHPMCNTTSELNILNIAITKSMKIIFWRPLSQFFIWNLKVAEFPKLALIHGILPSLLI